MMKQISSQKIECFSDFLISLPCMPSGFLAFTSECRCCITATPCMKYWQCSCNWLAYAGRYGINIVESEVLSGAKWMKLEKIFFVEKVEVLTTYHQHRKHLYSTQSGLYTKLVYGQLADQHSKMYHHQVNLHGRRLQQHGCLFGWQFLRFLRHVAS